MTRRRGEQTQFGARLFNLRRRANIRREELAQRSGLSHHLIQSLEQGRTNNPTVETVFRLARALGVPITALMDDLFADFEKCESRSMMAGEMTSDWSS